MTIPHGWQFSIASFDYRGWVFADEGIQARHSTSYYFQGSGFTGRFSERMNGPLDEYYHFREVVGLQLTCLVALRRKRALNVNTSVSVRNTNRSDFPDSEGAIGTDSIDGQIQQIWGISWRRCRS